MIAQNYGRIVNIASIAGKEGNPNAVAYSASKAGVIALTKSLGKELAQPRHRGQLHHAGRGPDRDLRPDDASSTSTTCCRKSRAAVSSRSRRSRRWSRSARRRTARSPPARCSTSPAGGRRIDRPRARAAPPAADRHRPDVRRGAAFACLDCHGEISRHPHAGARRWSACATPARS